MNHAAIADHLSHRGHKARLTEDGKELTVEAKIGERSVTLRHWFPEVIRRMPQFLLADRLTYDCETLRLSTRLTQIMAWLFAQRAAHEGEIPAEELAGEKYRLGGDDICVDNDPDTLEALPVELRGLMDRSYKLYQRIARLDEMVRRHGA